MPESNDKPNLPPEQVRQLSNHTRVTSWAIGRIKGTELTALRFNDGVPFALSWDDALNVGRALQAEAELIANTKPK